jgi:inorganic pyrophosphatase
LLVLDERRAWLRCEILTVPARDPRYAGLHDLADVPLHVRDEISHFFVIYKELEPGEATDSRGWQDRAAAEQAIAEATERGAAGDRPSS